MLRDLADALVAMPAATSEWDEKLVRACRKRATLHSLEFGSDRVTDATLDLALKMGVYRDAVGSLGGAMPSFLEARWNELEEARYTLAEALGMTEEPCVCGQPADHESFCDALGPKPADRGSCRMGGDHQPYPGNNFPHSCVRCGAHVASWPQQSTNQEVSP
jgi:hypothetical protein